MTPTTDELRAKYGPQSDKKTGGRAPTRKYAGEAGTGPPGETCGSCGHQRRSGNQRTYPKCGLVNWTSGDATTIKTRTPACDKWVADYPITQQNYRNPLATPDLTTP